MLTNGDLADVREVVIARRSTYFLESAERGKSNGELGRPSDVSTVVVMLKVLMLGVLHEAHVTQTVSDDVTTAIDRTLQILSTPLSVEG